MSRRNFSKRASLPTNVRRGEPETFYSTAKEFNEMLSDEKIIPYPYNRGSKGKSSVRDTSKKILERGYHPSSVGMIDISEGSWAEGHNAEYMTIEGHGRIEAIRRLCESDPNDPSLQKRLVITVHHHEDAQQVYEDKNSNKAHRSIEKITNPQFPLGEKFRKIKERLPSHLKPLLVDGYLQPLGDVIYLIAQYREESRNINDATMTSVFTQRSKLTKDLYCGQESLAYNENSIDEAIETVLPTVHYVLEVLAELRKEGDASLSKMKDYRNLFNSPGTFLTILWNGVSRDYRLVNRDPSRLAGSIIKKLSDWIPSAATVARRNGKEKARDAYSSLCGWKNGGRLRRGRLEPESRYSRLLTKYKRWKN